MRTDGRVMWGRLRTSLIRDAKGRPRQIIGQLEDVTAFRRAQQQLEELVSLQDRGLRYAEALSNCSRVLLMSRDLSELDEALRALLGALEASTITLEQNVDDPQVGAAARILREVDDTAPGHEPAGGLIPWSARSAAHARLVRGAHHSTWLPELPVSQQAAYPGTGKRSILEVPILTKGQWAGTIRVAESRNRREWQTDEIRLIRTAAEMIGVFWERQYAQERLEALVRSKDEFVASVSHELRTPLTTVLGLASELRDRKREFSEMEQHELVSLVADQATEVASIVEDLLVAARAEIDMVAISPQPVDLAAELDAVIAGLPATGRPPARVAAEHVWAEADPTRTRQVLRNLLTNAARYGGDHIEARVTADERSCVVEVLDDGPGIPPEHAARIFDPYHRAHDPVGQPASVGLGLTVARELARLMGGELEHRRIEGWTIFELRLPPAVDR
jgi:signal transduction histidine kinase